MGITEFGSWDGVTDDEYATADRLHGGQVRMAYRLAKANSDRLLFVYGIGWHWFDGTRWALDDQGVATRAVVEVLQDALSDSVADPTLRRDVGKCETKNGIDGVLGIAAALEPLAATVADMDADPYLLNCANGTLDLRTSELRAHDPADRLTKVTRAAYRPEARSQEWETFLGRVLPDEDVRGYLQRLIGLSLLGKVREHIFTIATGTGANGKGTSYTAILHAIGDYGHAAESDLFMAAKSNPNGASPALMGLLGKRLIVVSETEQDKRLATALMKNLTGGDPITARPLYGKPVTFDPSHTSLMVTNFLPKVQGDDPAAWRRIRVVPFDVVIPEHERDSHLTERLELAADAILAWAVAGYRDYVTRDGMDAPDAVKVATDAYRKDSDAVARFIDDCCLVNPNMHAPIGALFERWSKWAADDGAEPMSKRAFGEALDRFGYLTERRGGRSLRIGIGLQADSDDPDQDGWR